MIRSCTLADEETDFRLGGPLGDGQRLPPHAMRPDFFQGFIETEEIALYTASIRATLPLTIKRAMRVALSLLSVAAVVALTGCAGPENKFGRGMNNLTEIVRGGEMHRAIEQTSLWDGPTAGRTTGFARGFTRTMARTGIGLYEVVTFPLPPYKPLLAPKGALYPDPSVKTRKEPWGGLELPESPVFPESYKPGWRAGSIFDTDTSLGFSGGDVAPGFPGSRFNTLGY